jgi:hypothetical protein
MLDSRFNKIVWTYNGIAILLLVTAGLIAVIAEQIPKLIVPPEYERGLIVGKKIQVARDLNVDLQHLVYDSPQRVYKTDFYLSEVVVLDKEIPQHVKEEIAKANDISMQVIGATVNILFFKADRTVVRRLLPTNGFIDQVSVSRYMYGIDREKPAPFIIYKIATDDTNNDGRINYDDNMSYYMSGLDGQNLTRITPDSLKLDEYWIADDYSEIYFEQITEDRGSPLGYEDYFAKTRVLHYYNVQTRTFGRFEALQNQFDEIQREFKLKN